MTIIRFRLRPLFLGPNQSASSLTDAGWNHVFFWAGRRGKEKSKRSHSMALFGRFSPQHTSTSLIINQIPLENVQKDGKEWQRNRHGF